MVSFEKRDGEDRIHIHNSLMGRLFSAPFVSRGNHSGVYKVQVYKVHRRALSQDTVALLIRYYEGYTRSYHFQGTARLYVIKADKNDLTKMSMIRGPVIFEGKRKRGGHYF